jgi:hypothetical protein
MKRNVLSAAVLAVVILGLNGANAQINLLHTFEESNVYYDNNYDFCVYYCLNKNNDNTTVKIYNEDFSLRKIVNIPTESGYKFLGISYFSKKLFNTDEKLEFIVTSYNSGQDVEKSYIYNEDGMLLNMFEDVKGTRVFVDSKGNCKLSIFYVSKTEIYSLPGKNDISSNSIVKKATELAYKLKPGETATMKIYDVRGRLIETKQIDYVFNKVLLNTTNYSRGVYVYEINGLSKKFMVK